MAAHSLLLVVAVVGCMLEGSGPVHTAAMMQTKWVKPVTDWELKRSYEYVKTRGDAHVFFQIYEGKLYYYVKEGVTDFRLYKVSCIIRDLLLNEENQIPDTSFIIDTHDGVLDSNRAPDTMPIFVFSRDRMMRNATHYPLFPDDYSIGSGDLNDFYMAGLGVAMKVIREADTHRYRYKKKPIMWRGKNTSPYCWKHNSLLDFEPSCLHTPKITAVNLSKEHDFLDCKFAAPKSVIGTSDKYFGTSPANVIGVKGKAEYQKLLVMDGARSTFPGFAYSLMYNAVTLKVEGSNTKIEPQHVFEQWFHSQLVPYYHFYPIDSLSMNESLRKAYDYLEAHPFTAEEIAQRGRQFAQEMLTPCALEQYVVMLLRGWEGKAKVGSRKPFEGMTELTKANRNYCKTRYTNNVRNGLVERHGTLSSNIKKDSRLIISTQPDTRALEVTLKLTTTNVIVVGSVVILALLRWHHRYLFPW